MIRHHRAPDLAVRAPFLALLGGLAIVTFAGCATKGYVNKQIAASDATQETQIAGVRTDLDQTRARADQAYDKATLAERLAAGTLEYKEVSTHEVRFAFDDFALDDDARAALDDLGSKLTSYPRYVLEIRGYADASGSDRYNYRLGHERAESVERYLMSHHSAMPGRIAMVSFGEEEPVADNTSNDGRSQNRRVQVRLLDATLKPGETPLASAD